MRLFLISHSFLPFTRAGTEIYTWRLGRALSAQQEVHALFRVNDPRQAEYALQKGEMDGMRTYALNHTLRQLTCFEETYRHPRIDRIFAELLERVRPDVVHIQHLLFLSVGIIDEAKRRGIPVVLTLHDYWLMCGQGQLYRRDGVSCSMPDPARCISCLESQLCIRKGAMRWYQLLRAAVPVFLLQALKKGYLGLASKSGFDTRMLMQKVKERQAHIQGVLKSVDLFLSPSEFVRQKFIAFGVPAEKIRRYRQPVDQALLRQIQRQKSETVRFAFIGVLLPMKGVHLLIAAFRSLKAENAELLIYGKMRAYVGYEGYLRELKALAKKDRRIRFMGEFEPEKVGAVFAGIDILVVPSLWQENAPLVIQEAHAAGVPVIASAIGGIPEFVESGINGSLFPAGDSQALLRRLEEALGAARSVQTPGKGIPDSTAHASEMISYYERVCNAESAA